ncbi:hypothetical protein P7D22_20870 [Lichenihabitans sp. Uapishka_5]|uniref:hypothetical protein n=1 Tax=Lichenihabitans sp. Uapishka_5 TaxID=3037302 RepID=UPI0029E7FF6A|nr:hypothetical protein [Lichenihabitans sp. Uapishka_5]MDX7953620.1 hypothetical protein [Lichenihabitans sp. Uapishka_5]
MQLSQEQPGDLRATVNAVLTLDALAGVIFSAMKQIEHPTVVSMKRDDEFRDLLAERCHEFRALRDLAAAYKHGELTNPKKKQPRLLAGPERLNRVENQIGVLECDDEIEGFVLVVELIDESFLRASSVIGVSYQLLAPIVDEVDPLHTRWQA